MARLSALGTRAAMHRFMSDSRQSPIPQDRVAENVDHAQLAKDDQRQMAEQERYRTDQGIDERPDTNPDEPRAQTGKPTSASEGGE